MAQRKGRRATFWLMCWALSLGLWMLLVFKTEPAEVVAGAVAAAFAATAAGLLRSHADLAFSPDKRWLRKLGRLPRQVLVDCWILVGALWRRVVRGQRMEGAFRCIHFSASAGDDPRAQARLAVAKWLGAVAPNTYVVGFDERKEVVLVHQLVPTETPPDVDPAAEP
jgi:multisubunit Na+/H+ antiporter MnhE subunit